MLHIRHSLLPTLPSFTSRQVALSPVRRERDELIESIEQEKDAGMITLENVTDAEGLDQFWSGVQQDLKSDPTWYSFADD